MADPDRIQINEARIRAEFDELARLESVCALLVRETELAGVEKKVRGTRDGGSLEGKARRAGNPGKGR